MLQSQLKMQPRSSYGTSPTNKKKSMLNNIVEADKAADDVVVEGENGTVAN